MSHSNKPANASNATNNVSTTVLAWKQRTAFGALDWAKGKHQIVIVNDLAEIILKFSFAHSCAGWTLFREKILAQFPGLAIVLELSSGLIVEQLIATGLTVYGINPACTAAYRRRKIPSGTKDDEKDAWTLAEALRQDGAQWTPLVLPPQASQELALLTRDEVALIEQRTALINQLQATLMDYYPLLIEAFDDWTVPSTWDFLHKFPTPQKLLKAGPRQWNAFLQVHRMWRADLGPKRMALFAQADQLCASDAIVSAKSFLALKLVDMLRLIQTQLKHYRHHIQVLFDQHPDRALFDSLPGAGPKLAPRLLAEISGKIDLHDGPGALQCRAGTAPVRFQSGQINKAHIRRACDHRLRNIIHQWSDHSRRACTWAELYYQAHRKKGQSHACALRCLGQRWLNILYRMLKTNTPYNDALHTQNQLKHGSWVLASKTP